MVAMRIAKVRVSCCTVGTQGWGLITAEQLAGIGTDFAGAGDLRSKAKKKTNLPLN
jgi:hypothetical protein